MPNNFKNPYSLDTVMATHNSEYTSVTGISLEGVNFTANPSHRAVISDDVGPKWELNASRPDLQFGSPVLVRRLRLTTLDSGRVIVTVGAC